jgi:hypothetical protein
MATPTFFTIEGDYKSVVADTTIDTNVDPDLGPISATATFTPLIDTGDVLLAVTATPRPTGYVAAPIVARIDVDGQVKLRVDVDTTGFAGGDILHSANFAAFPATGNVAKIYVADDTDIKYRWTGSRYVNFDPVRLLADTPMLELDGPLYYRVDFTDVRFNGKAGILNSFVVRAKTTDTTLNLITEGRAPGTPASGPTRFIVPSGTPASAAAVGTVGQICADSSFLYVCVAANTWKRVAIATW